jgi:hypothetical protein
MRMTLTAILLALSASMASAQDVDFYGSNGQRATGMRDGNTMRFYDSTGYQGRAIQEGNTIRFYDDSSQGMTQRYNNIFRR